MLPALRSQVARMLRLCNSCDSIVGMPNTASALFVVGRWHTRPLDAAHWRVPFIIETANEQGRLALPLVPRLGESVSAAGFQRT